MRYYANPNDHTLYPDGSKLYRTHGPFASIAKVENCLCPDGKRRTVHTTGEADTFFSIPASVKVKGKTVTGYITTYSADGLTSSACEGWEFRANKYGKNSGVFDATDSQRNQDADRSHEGQEQS